MHQDGTTALMHAASGPDRQEAPDASHAAIQAMLVQIIQAMLNAQADGQAKDTVSFPFRIESY